MLLYANVRSFSEHMKARRWWESLLNGETEVAIAAPVLFGFIRLATSRQVFDKPLAVGEVLELVDGWLSRPHVRWAVPGPRHLEIAFDLLKDAGTAGNLTTDAQIAALAIEEQGEVHSSDTDFGRFRRLRWINPLRD